MSLIFCFFLFSKSVFALCPSLDSQGLRRYLSEHPSVQKILFFSTWCSDCRVKILGLKKDPLSSQKYLLIDVFDTPQRAQKVFEKIDLGVPCFYDRDKSILKEYHVTFVPYETGGQFEFGKKVPVGQ